MYEKYKFVFTSEHTISGDFSSTLFKNNIDFRAAISKNNKVIFAFHNMLQHKNWLFFTPITLASRRNNLLFNTTDNKLYDLGKITTDSVVYFLPPRIFSTINQADEQYVYTRISATSLLNERDKILSKNELLPEKIKELLGKLDKFDNTIIIRLKVQPSTAEK